MLPGSKAEPVVACSAGAGVQVTSSCCSETASISWSARVRCHVLVLGEALAGGRLLDDVADLVVLPGVGVVSRHLLDQLVVEHPGRATGFGAPVLGVGDRVLLEQPQPILVDGLRAQARLLGGDRDADLDAATGDTHLLADRDHGGGHLDLAGVQRDAGETAAVLHVVRQALQVAQRRRRARAGLTGRDSCPGRQAGRTGATAAAGAMGAIGATGSAAANPTGGQR